MDEGLSLYPSASMQLWHNKQLLSQFGHACHFEIAAATYPQTSQLN